MTMKTMEKPTRNNGAILISTDEEGARSIGLRLRSSLAIAPTPATATTNHTDHIDRKTLLQSTKDLGRSLVLSFLV